MTRGRPAFGLFAVNSGACRDPEVARRIGQAAEDAGFDSLWAGEHVVLPDPRVPPSPMEPLDDILDPIVTLTLLAGHTQRVRLGTGIIILPQRNPLVLAKQLASLDVLSGDRLIVGVGAGYLEPEFRALGVPFNDRGRRTDEYLGAMRAIWSEDQPSYRGRYVGFSGVQARPRPLQQPHPPIVIGGNTPAAYRRAVRQGNGWYGFALTPDSARQAVEGLRQAADQHPRPPELGALEISVTPRGPVDEQTVEQFAALGVNRLILLPGPRLVAGELEMFVTSAGDRLIRRA
jgi:probable F420-dependent oxidoreductase